MYTIIICIREIVLLSPMFDLFLWQNVYSVITVAFLLNFWRIGMVNKIL